MQFNLLATHTQNQIPIRNAVEFPIFLYYLLSGAKCLSKLSSTNCFAFSWSRNNPDCFPQHTTFISFYNV